MSRSACTVVRDCTVTTVPDGTPAVLRAGSAVEVVQALGGALTVRTAQGRLVRVGRDDADALGIDTGDLGSADVQRRVMVAATRFSMEQVIDSLRTVYDPEIPIDIVELGLVYRCEEELDADGHRRIEIDMSLTAPGCGMGDVLRAEVERVVGRLPGVDEVAVSLVWDPPWSFDRLSDEARLQLGLL